MMSLRRKQWMTLSLIAISSCLLGLVAVLAIHYVRTQYDSMVDQSLSLKADFDDLKKIELEISRDESFLNSKDPMLIAVQEDNFIKFSKQIDKIKSKNSGIIEASIIEKIVSSILLYKQSFDAAAALIMKEGLGDDSLASQLSRAMQRAKGSANPKILLDFLKLENDIARYMETKDESLHQSIISKMKTNRDLLIATDAMERIHENHAKIEAEKESFLKNILVLDEQIDLANQKIKTSVSIQREELAANTSFVFYGVMVLVVINILLIGFSTLMFNIVSRKMAEKSELLRQKNRDMATILENVRLGIFTITPEGNIHKEYSRYLEEILDEHELAGRNVVETIFGKSDVDADTISTISHIISSSMGENILTYEVNEGSLPVEVMVRTKNNGHKVIEMQWDPICENDILVKSMVSIKDVTEFRLLQLETERQKDELSILFEIIQVAQQKMEFFLRNNEEHLSRSMIIVADLDRSRDENLKSIKRHLHTLKGNARSFKFTCLANKVHFTEELVKDEAKVDRHRLRSQLQDLLTLWQTYERTYRERVKRNVTAENQYKHEELHYIKCRIREIMEMGQASGISQNLSSLYAHIKFNAGETLKSLIETHYRNLKELVHDEGKPVTLLHFEGDDVLLTEQATRLLNESIMHIFVNSVTHGVETYAERVSAGKPEHATITVMSKLQKDWLQITISDDGRGLNMKKLREIAEGTFKGMLKSDAELVDIIFSSGISTAETVSALAGRGVGLDAVRQCLAAEQGSITAQLNEAKETTHSGFRTFRFVMSIPNNFRLVEQPQREVILQSA